MCNWCDHRSRGILLLVSSLMVAAGAAPVLGEGATRQLPDNYSPSALFTVCIAISAPLDAIAMGLQDAPPDGWPASNLASGCEWDSDNDNSSNWEVRCGPYFAPFPDSLCYDVTPPADATGEQCFVGKVNFDGLVEEPIGGDTCVLGGCACDDGDACTEDSCDPGTGACRHDPIGCDDGDPCTDDSCDPATGCVNAPVDCDDGVVCTDDFCDPVTGECLNPDNCPTGQTCNPDTGACECDDNSDCDDGNPCTEDTCCTDTCDFARDGECDEVSGLCDPGTDCTDCQLTVGACAHTSAPDGTDCDDGNGCTSGDSCQGGTCTGTPSPDPCCGSSDPCCGNSDPCCGSSDPCCGSSDQCCGVVCNDNDPCTTDSCSGGLCVFTPIVCDDDDPCTTDTCVDGVCKFDTDCDDGNACTENDTCTNKTCTGTPVECDDNDPCTEDVCDDGTCVNTPIECDDGDACNGTETCQNGTCVDGTPLNCDDDNPCTDDSCNSATGCVFTPDDTNACDDGDACNGGETCQDGACITGTPVDCDDDDLCTDDSCDPILGCVNDAIECPEGKDCIDGECVWVLGVRVRIDEVDGDGEPVEGVPFPLQDYHGNGVSVELAVPDSPCGVGELCVFLRWQGNDVSPENERDDPLSLMLDSNKSIMAVFQVVSCIEDADCTDGKFCSGEEQCIDSECLPGEPPCSSGQTCDEDSNECVTIPNIAREPVCGLLGSGCGPTGPATILLVLGLFALRFVGPGRRARGRG